MNIILTGGFTGGHIIPLLRLKDKLKNNTYYYVGFKGSLEEELVKDIPFFGLSKPNGKFNFFRYKNYNDVLKSYLNNLKIDAVISSGGKHSYPMCEYARKFKLPLYLIEENSKMGLLNILYKRYAKEVFVSFPYKNKYIYAINPTTFFDVSHPKKEFDITFVGGSLGSDVISKIALELRNSKLKIALVCGKKEKKLSKYNSENFKVFGYTNSIELFEKSNLVVTRGGSSTIFELLKINIPFVIIPARKTKRHHQEYNALFFQKENLAIYLDERKVTGNDILKIYQMDFKKMLESQKLFLERFDTDIYEKTIIRRNN